MDAFRSIERGFQALRRGGRFERALDRWRDDLPQLASIESVEAIIQTCRAPEPEGGGRDPILSALCAAATQPPKDEMASLLLCWLFLPGLYTALSSIPRPPWFDAEDLASEALVGFLEAAGKIDSSTTAVARRLLRGARQAAVEAVRKAEVSWDNVEPLPDEFAGSGDDDPAHTYDDTFERAAERRIVSSENAKLVQLDRGQIEEAASRQGLSRGAVYSRRKRARRRLREWLSESSRDYA